MINRTRVLATLALGATVAFGAAACGDDDGGDSVFSLGVGQCFDDISSAGGEVNEVPTVECSEPHANEVYAVFDLEGEEYPGEDVVEAQAAEGCLSRFEEYVGAAYETSALDINFLSPLEQGWNELDDREVVCFTFNVDRTPLTGSVQGSAR